MNSQVPEPNKPKDDIELQLFELLEQMTEGQSFCSNAPIVDKFVNTRLDISPIPQDHHHHSSSVATLNSTTSNNSSSSRHRTNSLGSNKSNTSMTMTKIDGGTISPSMRTARSRVNSISSNKSSGSSVTSSEKQKNTMSPEVLQRVLELVRNESEKTNGKSPERGGGGGGYNNPEFHGALLTAKTMELELEIKKFRDENQKLDILRQGWQTKCYELENEQKQFDQLKDRELRFIEDEKSRLARKKERVDKLKEEYENKLGELNCKTECSNDEVNRLRTKVCQLEKELALKNTRFVTAQKKLDDQIQVLEEKNKKLRSQLDAANGRKSKVVVDHHLNNNKQQPPPPPKRTTNFVSTATNTTTGFVSDHGDFHEDEPVYNMPASPVSPSSMYPSSSVKQQKSDVHHHRHPRGLVKDVGQQTPRDEYQEGLNNGSGNGALAAGEVGIERILPTGDREIRYSNGTTRTVSADSRWTK